MELEQPLGNPVMQVQMVMMEIQELREILDQHLLLLD
jgi:hypothetical protein